MAQALRRLIQATVVFEQRAYPGRHGIDFRPGATAPTGAIERLLLEAISRR